MSEVFKSVAEGCEYALRCTVKESEKKAPQTATESPSERERKHIAYASWSMNFKRGCRHEMLFRHCFCFT